MTPITSEDRGAGMRPHIRFDPPDTPAAPEDFTTVLAHLDEALDDCVERMALLPGNDAGWRIYTRYSIVAAALSEIVDIINHPKDPRSWPNPT